MSKDNANPVIHSVNDRKWNHRSMLEPIKRWKAGNSIEDRCIREAIEDHATLLQKFNCFDDKEENSSSSLFFTPITSSQNKKDVVMEVREKIDAAEIFEHIRTIQDPEHPLTLEQLNVVNLEHVIVEDNLEESSSTNNTINISRVDVRFTPTVPHCSMATLIGLSLRVKLLRSLPSRFKVTVRIQPGTHASEQAINKQLADKERVAAALENAHLLG
eukprot:CAMPEP_0194182202 /NCGR_PEP_ID=MMETSP0154-20130528/22211_1 /TAXON_ID=1049557 /ORGANISM="Thalassiothrix antarctica, Strain L6-D1" /LENGTH=215 /DNA_ID=CAMNT_0038898369 /DNA_START=52 /DNA_END=696 /DNA_ORIENTATION=+